MLIYGRNKSTSMGVSFSSIFKDREVRSLYVSGFVVFQKIFNLEISERMDGREYVLHKSGNGMIF